jgi:hypothetical protein
MAEPETQAPEAAPETAEAVDAAEAAPEAEPEADEAAPEAEPEADEAAPEVETAVSTDPEPGSPRRKRPREPAPSLVVPRLDASFWTQLVHESRATREASRRERFANLMRF